MIFHHDQNDIIHYLLSLLNLHYAPNKIVSSRRQRFYLCSLMKPKHLEEHLAYNRYFKFLKIYFVLSVLGVCVLCCIRAFSSCSKQELLSSCGARASHSSGFSCCKARALELGLPYFRSKGLVSPRQATSSQTRSWTQVPCIGRWILNDWTTMEVFSLSLFIQPVDRYLLNTYYGPT